MEVTFLGGGLRRRLRAVLAVEEVQDAGEL